MKSVQMNKRMFPILMGSILICLSGCGRHLHSPRNQAPGKSKTVANNHNNKSGASANHRGALVIPAAAIGAAATNLGEIPNDVPPATAINTKGGRLLVGYLKGTFSGESVVEAVFDSEPRIPYRLAEISAAILKLRSAGQFTAEDEDKVQLLETALNKRLVETIQYHENLDHWIKYGVALAASVPAAIWAPEIVGAGQGVLESSIVQTPKNYIVRGFQGAYRGVMSIFRRKSAQAAAAATEEVVQTAEQRAAERVAEAETERAAESVARASETQTQTTSKVTDEFAGTIGEGIEGEPQVQPETVTHAEPAAETSKTAEAAAQAQKAEKAGLFSRVVGSYKTRAGRLTAKEVAIRDINHALSSPDLAHGFEVNDVPEEQLGNVKLLKFSRTGITGFGMHQTEGSKFLVVRELTPGGYKYFYVNGRAIEILTQDGQRMVVKGPTVIKIASDRMKGWAQDATTFFGRGGRGVKNAALKARDLAFNNRVSQWLTSQAGKRAIQSTAVGSAAGMLALWAVNPIDTQYLTVNDYLNALSKQGINLNDFPDELRTELQQEAKVPHTLAQPMD